MAVPPLPLTSASNAWPWSAVTVCSAVSMLVTVTVAPGDTVIGFPKAKSLMVMAAAAEPGIPWAVEGIVEDDSIGILAEAEAEAVPGAADVDVGAGDPPPEAHPATPVRSAAKKSEVLTFPVFIACRPRSRGITLDENPLSVILLPAAAK